MALILVITDAGRAALVNAKNDGTNAVRIASVGVSATAVTAAPAATTLPGETKRVATISGGAVAKDVMHLVVRDETMDNYTLRSFALYLDNGVLFGLYGQATPIIEKSAQALLLLAVDVTLQDVAAGQITFGDANFLQPPATTDRPGVVELATEAEAAGGTDRTRAITPYTLRITYGDVWRASNDGAGSGLDADMLDGLQATDFLRRNTGGRPLDYDSGSGQMFIGADAGGWDIGYRFRDSQGSTLASFGASGGANSLSFVYMGPSYAGATTLRVYPDRVTWGANALWHAANDGAGSGLDADLLDGRQGADFALLSGAEFSGPVTAHKQITGNANVAAYPIVNPTSIGTAEQLIVGESSHNPAYRVSIGYWLDTTVGQYRGVINAIGASNPVPLDLQPSGGLALFGGAVTAGKQITGNANIAAYPAINPTSIGTAEQLIVGEATHNPAYRLTLGYWLDAGSKWRGVINAIDASAPAPLDIQPSGGASMFGGSANVAGSLTRAGNRVWDAANDGAGSGLDADLVDGRQASEFALLAGANFGDLTRGGNRVWDAGNDGSGSGLDADMVDGWHRDDIRRWGNLLDVPGAFPPAAHAHSAADIAGAFPGSLSENGYTVLPNGLILQWVSGALMGAGQETTQLVYFPVAFPNACFGAVASTRDEFFSRAADVMFATIGAPSPEAVTVGRKQFSGTSDDQVASRPFIIALGR